MATVVIFTAMLMVGRNLAVFCHAYRSTPFHYCRRASATGFPFRNYENHNCMLRRQQQQQYRRLPLLTLQDSSSVDGETETTTVSAKSIVSEISNHETDPSEKDSSHTVEAISIVAVPDPSLHQQRSRIIAWIEHNLLFGNTLSLEIGAIATIYFVEGALGLSRLAQSYLLKDELHLGPAELSAITGLFVLPWTIKPLYGFLSDGFPLFGYQRKSYLIAAGILGSISYGILGVSGFWESLDTSLAVSGTVAALLVSSACIAMSDVVADGIVVTRSRQAAANDEGVAGGLQSLCWGASAIGGLISAYFSGSLLEVLPVRAIFGITAILPFLVALIAFGIDEEPIVPQSQHQSRQDVWQGIQKQIETLSEAMRLPAIWKPAVFIFLWQSTPTADGAFFYFLTNDLQLGPEFLGRVRLVTAAAGLFGVWLYNEYLKNVRIRNVLFWSTLASFPLGMLPILLITHVNREIGIPDEALIYGDDVALSILGQISFLPTLVLAARLCPPGVEAVLFATLMSLFNGAGTVGTEIGALLTKLFGITESNFDYLAWLTVLCNVTSLWPLVLIGWLDTVDSERALSENWSESAPDTGEPIEIDRSR